MVAGDHNHFNSCFFAEFYRLRHLRPLEDEVGVEVAVPGVRDALVARRSDTVAVSPIVAGSALKGPADRLLDELGHEATVVGVARLYAPLAEALVIDHADADLADDVAAEGIRPILAESIMRTPEVAAALARTVLAG